MNSLQKGQALLVVILIMAVVLTIALSLVSRTVTDINISKKEDDSSRAFSAAEAGIEQALLKGSSGTFAGNVTSQDNFTVSSTSLASGGTEFPVPLLLSAGETAPVWLVEHANDGSLVCSSPDKKCFTGTKLDICWGTPGTQPDQSTTPALEASILYLTSDSDFSTARIARVAYDPNTSRTSSNNFVGGSDSSNCTISGTQYQFQKTLDLSALGVTIRPTDVQRRGPQYVRLRMLYNTTQAQPAGVRVNGSGVLPLQGSKVTASGTSGTATRNLEVYQLFSDLPPVFDNALFSGAGGIVK